MILLVEFNTLVLPLIIIIDTSQLLLYIPL